MSKSDNMDTAVGRFWYWFRVCNPANSFYADETLKLYQSKVEVLSGK